MHVWGISWIGAAGQKIMPYGKQRGSIWFHTTWRKVWCDFWGIFKHYPTAFFVSHTNELWNLDWTRHQIWSGQPPRPIKVGNNCMHGFALTSKFFVVGEKPFGIPQRIGLIALVPSHITQHIVKPVTNEGFLFGISQKIGDCHKEPYRDYLGHPKSNETFARSWKTFSRSWKFFLRSWKTFAGRFLESQEGFELGGLKLVVRSHLFTKVWQIPWLGCHSSGGLWRKGGTFGAEQALGWVGVPYKLLPVRIALILAYFGAAGTMFC